MMPFCYRVALLLLLNSYTKYIRTNKNNKSKRNTLDYSVQIDLMNVISGFKYKLNKNFAIANITPLKMAPFDRLNAVLKKQKW